MLSHVNQSRLKENLVSLNGKGIGIMIVPEKSNGSLECGMTCDLLCIAEGVVGGSEEQIEKYFE